MNRINKKNTRRGNDGRDKKSIFNANGNYDKNQESFKHFSDISPEILDKLTPKEKFEEEESDVTFLLHVALIPHRISMRRAIVARLYQYRIISKAQFSYFFNVFNLGGK